MKRLTRLCSAIACVLSLTTVALAQAEAGVEDFQVIGSCYASPLDDVNSYVFFIYVALSFLWVYSIAVMIERFLTYGATAKVSRLFRHKALLALSVNRLDEAGWIADAYSPNPLARAMGYVFKTRRSNPHADSSTSEFYTSAQGYVTVETEQEMNKGLEGLQKAGWMSLALGCLGACIGLIDAFRLSARLADADYQYGDYSGLYRSSFNVFYFSLFIALPALWAQRKFVSQANRIVHEIDLAAWEMINRLIKIPATDVRATSQIETNFPSMQQDGDGATTKAEFASAVIQQA